MSTSKPIKKEASKIDPKQSKKENLKTESPLSEKDEVKAAEEKMKKIVKK